ncbi:hypothetical protein GY21_12620 [Cryobacterium roopkundense]|uniref:AcrR family transcriptional regulator n=1 Tax=Cryobacterium roopkundense TaxID=1001240 RepID=A0A099J429_9MICO|nr:TetR/AcrR family transcriptional regulator [Cryobacterium roopkundense]KGJ72840.1 hypothetical protein GY21_12620 [Cryobacterium roopkundense]MBB5641201.1 AcrR family transcriptional regulator [Cryobacterium roopkundense]
MHPEKALANVPSGGTEATLSLATLSLKDPRAERTRQLIFGAVADLMSAPAATAPATASVTDIVRGAGISRSSFYAHFSSLDDVASELVRTQFARISSSGPPIPGETRPVGRRAARAGYTRLVEHLASHSPLYARVRELPLTRSTYDGLVRDYSRRVVETAAMPRFVPDGINAQMAATYTAAGALGLITSWMGGDFEASADEIVDELVNLLPTWLITSGT